MIFALFLLLGKSIFIYWLGKNSTLLWPLSYPTNNIKLYDDYSGLSSANSIGEYSFVFETDIQNITQFLIDAADPTDDPAWIEEIKEVLLSLKK